jgi:hypothetical protein
MLIFANSSILFHLQELSANLDLSMTRANRADGLETELANAQQTIRVLQMSLW